MNEALAGLLEAADTVVFDFDGVLADTEPLHLRSYRELIADLGGELDDDVFRRLIGRKEREIWPQVISRPVALDELVARRAELFLAIVREERLAIDPRVEPLLAFGGPERVLLSSGNPVIVERLLDGWGIAGRFTEVHALGDSALAKAEVLRRLVRERRAHGPWRGVLVEDSPHMIAEAAALGLATIGVVHSMNRHEDVEAADAVV